MAESSNRRRSLVIGGLAVLAIGGFHTALVKPAPFLGAENLALAALGGLAVAAGDASRNRRAYLAEVEARAQRAERDREAEARAGSPRSGCASPATCTTASATTWRSSTCRPGWPAHVLDRRSRAGDPRDARADPPGAAGPRSTNCATRSACCASRASRPPRSSRPSGLSGLPDLLAACARSGLRVTVAESAYRPRLPWATDVTAYRVIQESLTNARKHAGPVPVSLTVTYAHRVVDASRWPTTGGSTVADPTGTA